MRDGWFVPTFGNIFYQEYIYFYLFFIFCSSLITFYAQTDIYKMNFIIIKVENENTILNVLTALPPGGGILRYGP